MMTITGSRSWVFAGLAALVLGLAAYAVFDREAGWLQVRSLQRKHDSLSAETSALEARRAFLSARLDSFEKGDPFTLEEVAREKNLIHPGDTVFRVYYRPAAYLDSAR